ncbi:MAG: tyrosine-protein phosphatase [Verrucomicrobiota bacterium]
MKCRIILFAFIPAFIFICIQGWRIFTHNIHPVDQGRVFRSSQLNSEDLEKTIRQYHLKTVINLRGKNTHKPWYDEEIEICQRLGIDHLDIRWSAKHLPEPDEILKLLHAFHTATYPLLLHCQAGADRTGLASALYLIDQKHLSSQEAAHRSLNLAVGHMALYPYFEMDEFLIHFENSQGIDLEQWVTNQYPTIYAQESKESTWNEMIEPLVMHQKRFP